MYIAYADPALRLYVAVGDRARVALTTPDEEHTNVLAQQSDGNALEFELAQMRPGQQRIIGGNVIARCDMEGIVRWAEVVSATECSEHTFGQALLTLYSYLKGVPKCS